MKRVGFKPGLIRYASEKMIAEGRHWHFTLRSGIYTVLLTILLSVFFYFLITRHDVEATVMRSPGLLYQDLGNGQISNLYDIKIVNKTVHNLSLDIRLLSPRGTLQLVGTNTTVKKQIVGEMAFFVILDRKELKKEKVELEIGVFSGGKKLDQTRATFLAPSK